MTDTYNERRHDHRKARFKRHTRKAARRRNRVLVALGLEPEPRESLPWCGCCY